MGKGEELRAIPLDPKKIPTRQSATTGISGSTEKSGLTDVSSEWTVVVRSK